jgi:hypothetical protein
MRGHFLIRPQSFFLPCSDSAKNFRKRIKNIAARDLKIFLFFIDNPGRDSGFIQKCSTGINKRNTQAAASKSHENCHIDGNAGSQ